MAHTSQDRLRVGRKAHCPEINDVLGDSDPLDEALLALDRLGDLHRRMDEVSGVKT